MRSRELLLQQRPTFVVDVAVDAETALRRYERGYGNVQLEQLAAERGAYAFLHKPVDPDAFFSVVDRAVLRAAMRRRPQEVLGEDSSWYPQAVEQARRRSNAIAERLRKTIPTSDPPSTETP